MLVYFHGGGWVVGDIPGWDRPCRSLAAASGCIVVSVEYRLAPEDKFPAAAEDAYAALQWLIRKAASLGGDPARVAVGGDSAGGNLATVACLMARDRGGFQAAYQLLVYPVVDFEHESSSMREYAENHFLTRAGMRKFWDFYLNSPADGDSPYASPSRADLTGLPPAFVLTAECDPLRDQGLAYAAKLRRAGVEVQAKCYDGAIHAFFTMAGVVDCGKQAISDAGAALRAALSVPGNSR
jgi:acetyl esterase